MLERELKAVVTDPEAIRRRLVQAGAIPGFRGLMTDRRFDRAGALLARDEVLRIRELRRQGGDPEYRLSWKGPTSVSPDGYKSRTELEYRIEPRGTPPDELLLRLGFVESQRIDRYVEYYGLGQAEVRLEWYPRMDRLIEVEGEPEAIERALALIGLPREDWRTDALPVFAARYAERTGTPAALALEALGDAPPPWPPQ